MEEKIQMFTNSESVSFVYVQHRQIRKQVMWPHEHRVIHGLSSLWFCKCLEKIILHSARCLDAMQ